MRLSLPQPHSEPVAGCLVLVLIFKASVFPITFASLCFHHLPVGCLCVWVIAGVTVRKWKIALPPSDLFPTRFEIAFPFLTPSLLC